MAAGLGTLRLPPRDFWAMTPRELDAALRGALRLGRARRRITRGDLLGADCSLSGAARTSEMVEPIDGIVSRHRRRHRPVARIAQRGQPPEQRSRATSTRAFEDAALKGRSLADVLRSLALSLSGHALEAALSPITKIFGGALSGLLAGAGGAVLPMPFASGGVIASPVAFPLGGRARHRRARRGRRRSCRCRAGRTDGSACAAAGRRRRRHRHLQRHRRRMPTASAARRGRSRRCSPRGRAGSGIFNPRHYRARRYLSCAGTH